MRLKSEEGEEVLDADLVLDAAGRGSCAVRWLEALGYPRPPEERVDIDLGYTSRVYERPADFKSDFRVMMVTPRKPARRGAFLQEIEGGRLLVTLNGYFNDHAPTSDEGFLSFARSLPVPDVYEIIKGARPITEPTLYKVPSSRWLHYENMPSLPDGLLLLGDSVCVLNPIYGQGMTMAIKGAHLLEGVLAERSGRGGDLRDLPRAFQTQLAGLLRPAWMLSTTMDLAYPEAKGKRALALGALQWAFMNLVDLTTTNESACRIFYEILHMRRGLEALASPGMLLPLLAHCTKSLFVPLKAPLNETRRPAAP